MTQFFSVRHLILAMLLMLPNGRVLAQSSTIANLKQQYPGLQVYEPDEEVSRLYGVPFGAGSSPVAAAKSFLAEHASVFGVTAEELVPIDGREARQHAQPLMFDYQTGQYKFTLVSYAQQKAGIPVAGAEVRLLIRNNDTHDLCLLTSSLRDIEDYSVDPVLAAKDPNTIVTEFTNRTAGVVGVYGEPRLVIWAERGKSAPPPTVGAEFIALDSLAKPPQTYRYIVSAQTGALLLRETMICNATLTGTVTSHATKGLEPFSCEADSNVTLPYKAMLVQGGDTTFTTASGEFRFDIQGVDSVTLLSPITGEWFYVKNEGVDGNGVPDSLTLRVASEGNITVSHNVARDQLTTAQTNAYVFANGARDYARQYNPQFPGINEQIKLVVNLLGHCYGSYDPDPTLPVITLEADTGIGIPCHNGSYSGTVRHEYGHHLVDRAGSGQFQYGEGMADAFEVLISDTSGVLFGHSTTDCNAPLRNGDNDLQYDEDSPCYPQQGGQHYCGQLLSGCVWATRQALVQSNPLTYRGILSNLTINSILLHTGTEIDPGIFIDFLTLDDDDANLTNRTPHYAAIRAGFLQHGMVPQEFGPVRAYYVDGLYGNNVTGDGSVSHPYKTIERGVEEAFDGDSVVVRPTVTYSGIGNVGIDLYRADITLVSSSLSQPVTIDCQGSGRAFVFNQGEVNCKIQRFVIKNGWDNVNGGGAQIRYSSPWFDSCTFENCHAPKGGAVYIESFFSDSAKPIFSNCTFVYNSATAGSGGAIYIASHPAIDVLIQGCVFDSNQATGSGGTIYAGGSTVLRENTIVHSVSGGSRPATITIGGDSPVVLLERQILAYNTSYALDCQSALASVELAWNVFWSNLEGNFHPQSICDSSIFGWHPPDSNFIADPSFCSAVSPAYSLQWHSPCDENNSPPSERIGARGITCAPPVLLSSPTDEAITFDITPTLDWLDVPMGSGAGSYEIQVDNSSVFDSPDRSTSGLSFSNWTVDPALPLYNTWYYWRVRATNTLLDNTTIVSLWSGTRKFKILQEQIQAVPAQASHRITLDSVSGLNNADTIQTSSLVTFYLRITSFPEPVTNTTRTWNGFRVYSPTGAHWTDATGQYTEAITEEMMASRIVYPWGSDGHGVDTIHFDAEGGCGLPPDFDEVALTITIGPIDTSYVGHTVCLDSLSMVVLGPWFWDLGICDVLDRTVSPEWDGPHCFSIANPPCGISATGDLNLDSVIGSADIIGAVNYIFKTGAPPQPCPASSDVNCSGSITSADIIYLVNHVFKSGPAPCNVCSLIWSGTLTCP